LTEQEEKMMNKILLALSIVLASMTVHAQTDNSLKAGMPNTLTLPNGEVIYDLNGEWDAVYDSDGWGIYKDIVRITQKEKHFAGIYLIKGDNLVGKNQEKIKGEIRGSEIDEIFFNDVTDMMTMKLHWAPSKAEISEDGNKIMIKRAFEEKGATLNRTISLKRKIQEKTTAVGADKVKTILLRPDGWWAEWRGTPPKQGTNIFIFEARGENVVVKINVIQHYETCEHNVTITSDFVKMDGCYDTNILLFFDPNDHEYPFKGEGQNYKFKLKAK
jgi:hypothetical protein